MTRKIVIANQKGGVGKSTTVINLGASLALQGQKVLIIDLDPQGNTGSGLGIRHKELKQTVYHLMTDPTIKAEQIVLPLKIKNLFIMPSDPDLSGAHVELSDRKNRYFILDSSLKEIQDSYDYILIDTPPSLGFLTLNSFCAAREVLIPLQAEYYAMEGISQLLKTIQIVQKKLHPSLSILGIVITMYDARLNLSSQVVEEVSKYFHDKVFQTMIPRNVRLSEAPSFGQAVIEYQPSSVGAVSYMELAKEVLKHG